MAITKSAVDEKKIARHVMQILLNSESVCAEAKTQALSFRYDSIVSIPAVASNFKQVVDNYAAIGYGGAEIAPVVGDVYGIDVTNFATDLTAIYNAIVALGTAVINNGNLLRHSIDASGGRVYDQPLSTATHNALINLLDDVLSNYS